jgi:type VI secretion system protein ImpH
VGEWHSVTNGGQLDVGSDGDEARLGFGVVGDAAFDPHARVRLRIGPLNREQFDAFLPGGTAHGKLSALARTYADAQVGIDVQLVLDRTAVPRCALNTPDTPKLGFGTWLQSRPMTRDPDDVTLALD